MRQTPERLTRGLLLCSLFGFAYRGHWVYSAEEKVSGVGPYLDFARGMGAAPVQYRVGVMQPAAWAYLHWHLPFRYSFSLLDIVGSILAVLLGYHLLLRTSFYQRAPLAARWFGSSAYAALVLYLTCWQDNFKKVETQPAAALVMMMLWLWTPDEETPRQHGAARAAALLFVALALSTLRPEFPVMLSAGIFLMAWHGGKLALGRGLAMATAAGCAAVGLGAHLLLARVLYPQAHYLPGRFFMLPKDIWRLNELLCFVVFLLPAAWTLHQVRRRRFTADAAGVGFLLGSVPFVTLWMLIGRIEEVRIFLPLALALVPLTVRLAMLMATEPLAEPAHTR